MQEMNKSNKKPFHIFNRDLVRFGTNNQRDEDGAPSHVA